MESQRRRFAFRIRPAGEITGKEQCADSRDIRLESQREQTELQLDVFIERLRHTDGDSHVGWCDGRCLHCNLKPAFDLPNIFRILVKSLAIVSTGLPAKT